MTYKALCQALRQLLFYLYSQQSCHISIKPPNLEMQKLMLFREFKGLAPSCLASELLCAAWFETRWVRLHVNVCDLPQYNTAYSH